MSQIYIKCNRCEAELPLKERHYDLQENSDLRVYRVCDYCEFENEEIIYLG